MPNEPRVCVHCSKKFFANPSDIKRGFGRFCSRGCRDTHGMTRIPRICHTCGDQFWILPADLRKAARGGYEAGQYCSKPCYFKGKAKPSAERFWALVEKRSEDECWFWLGCKFPNGYGQFEKKLAHRVAYELTYSPIASKYIKVCHDCDIRYPVEDKAYRACVNPHHLFTGTQKDNLQDAASKGRMLQGSRNHQAKLNEDKAQYILSMKGKITSILLAAEMKVSRPTITRIWNRKIWRHVP